MKSRSNVLLLGLLLVAPAPALGQVTRDDWRAQRDMVSGAAAGARSSAAFEASATAGVSLTNGLSLVSSRSFADVFGDLVIVGEVQNVTGFTLSFSEVIFDFYNGSTYLDTEFTFAFGSHNARLQHSGSYINVLPPGEIGFFKVWTDLRATSVTTHVFRSHAETYGLLPVFANLQAGPINLTSNTFGTNYTGTVRNPTGSFTTFYSVIALAGYSGGAIADVAFTFANGSGSNLCIGGTASTIAPGETVTVNGSFLRPVTAVGRVALEWDEYGIVPAAQTFNAPGGTGTVSVVGNCTWTAVSNAPWITVTSAPSSSGDGVVTFSVAPNARRLRTGTLTIAGHTFTVTQAASLLATDGDFNADGRSDLAVFRPQSGTWFLQNVGSSTWGAPGDVPVPADYDGDRRMDVAIYRPSSGTWFIQGGSAIGWGSTGDIPVPADYNGDGRADVAVFRPSTGTWFIQGQGAVAFGAPGDIPVPGDYTGAGRAQIAVYRRGLWYVLGQAATSWGAPGDLPVPGDYDGDGRVDVAIFRPATGLWFILGRPAIAWGAAGDLPVPQDLDGDGRTDLVVFRAATGAWYAQSLTAGTLPAGLWGAPGDVPVLAARLRSTIAADLDGDRRADLTVAKPAGPWRSLLSSTQFASGPSMAWGATGDIFLTADFLGLRRVQRVAFRAGEWFVNGGPTLRWGTAGDVPVPADYDGDGRADAAVFRNGAWYVLYSSRNFTTAATFVWGTAGDIARPGDFDGDGRADFAVFRNGVWYILFSSLDYSTSAARLWGTSGDIPVNADYDGDGRSDLAIYRPAGGLWYVVRSSDNTMVVDVFGGEGGDLPVPADYDGDGRVDVAIFRGNTRTWHILRQPSIAFGDAAEAPIVPRP